MNELRNMVQLIGHLGSDPEIKKFDSGKSKASFSIATNESYKAKNGEWEKDTQWHNVVAWDPLVERIKKTLAKGKEVAILGRLTHRSYESEGVKKFITEVVASSFETFEKANSSKASETVKA